MADLNSYNSYTGRFTGEQKVAIRRLPHILIYKQQVGSMGNNAYLLLDENTGKALLINAAADYSTLADLIAQAVKPSGSLTAVVTTHSHPDHVGALSDIVRNLSPITLAGADDAPALPVQTDILVDDTTTFAFGDSRCSFITLNGHTPGSIAVVYRDPATEKHHIFTGDSLFPGGVGNTDHDPARFNSLLSDVTTKIFDVFSDDTWVYPGHGNDTTLGEERPHLPEWQERGW